MYVRSKPVVSVIMPVYNGEKTIEQAIESVLKQDVELELLVIDDGSKDRTGEVLEKYKNDARVRYLINERNLGVARTRNLGVAKAEGKYVAFLDADDWWAEGKLHMQIKRMEETGCVISSTARRLVDPLGKELGKTIPVKERIGYRDLLGGNPINCSSVVVLRDVIARYPMEHDDAHEDYLCWLRILRDHGDCAALNLPLLYYRVSENSKSGNKLHSAVMNYRVFRYMGFSIPKSIFCFLSYAFHGVMKYR